MAVLEYEGSECPRPGDPITAWIASGNDFKDNRRPPKGPPRTTSTDMLGRRLKLASRFSGPEKIFSNQNVILGDFAAKLGSVLSGFYLPQQENPAFESHACPAVCFKLRVQQQDQSRFHRAHATPAHRKASRGRGVAIRA